MDQQEKIELLATKVMGWYRGYYGGEVNYYNEITDRSCGYYDDKGHLKIPNVNWNPYTSIADAWMIVEKLEINDYFWRSHRSLHNKVSFTFFLITDTEPPLYQCCGTLQEAICEAAIKTIDILQM